MTLIKTQSDYFSCHDLILGFDCRIQVKFLVSMQWSLFYGSLNVYIFFTHPVVMIIIVITIIISCFFLRRNGNAMFYETFIEKKQKRHKLNVSHSTSFNIIQEPRTMIQTKTSCFIQVEINKCLIQHCVLAWW